MMYYSEDKCLPENVFWAVSLKSSLFDIFKLPQQMPKRLVFILKHFIRHSTGVYFIYLTARPCTILYIIIV